MLVWGDVTMAALKDGCQYDLLAIMLGDTVPFPTEVFPIMLNPAAMVSMLASETSLQ